MTQHTPAEMRSEAEWIAHTGNDLWARHHVTRDEAARIGKTAAMLRQAADAMEAIAFAEKITPAMQDKGQG